MTRLGSLAWMSAIQFFVAQWLVARAWTTPFDLAERHISDLGNTACGLHVVCSPWHAVMNASFVAIGITMAAGALLARGAFVAGARRTTAVVLFCVAGAGVILVGAFPENTVRDLHAAGAGLNFLCGNLALLVFGLALPAGHRRLTRFSIAAGVLGLMSTVLFGLGRDLGLGHGTMERLAAYPMPIWQMVVGLAIFRRTG